MKIALLQLNVSDDPAANLIETRALLREAVAGGAAIEVTGAPIAASRPACSSCHTPPALADAFAGSSDADESGPEKRPKQRCLAHRLLL